MVSRASLDGRACCSLHGDAAGDEIQPAFCSPSLGVGLCLHREGPFFFFFFLIHIKRPHEPAAALSREFAALDSLHVSHASGLAAVPSIPGSSPPPPFMPLPRPLLTLLY